MRSSFPFISVLREGGFFMELSTREREQIIEDSMPEGFLYRYYARRLRVMLKKVTSANYCPMGHATIFTGLAPKWVPMTLNTLHFYHL